MRANIKNNKGFTLIELIVVVVILGIHSSIAIVAFNNQRQRAFTAAVKSDVRNAATGMETGSSQLGV